MHVDTNIVLYIRVVMHIPHTCASSKIVWPKWSIQSPVQPSHSAVSVLTCHMCAVHQSKDHPHVASHNICSPMPQYRYRNSKSVAFLGIDKARTTVTAKAACQSPCDSCNGRTCRLDQPCAPFACYVHHTMLSRWFFCVCASARVALHPLLIGGRSFWVLRDSCLLPT